jgi:TolC family type I secretion outer membrane protein
MPHHRRATPAARALRALAGACMALSGALPLAGCSVMTGSQVDARIADEPSAVWHPPADALPAADQERPQADVPSDLLAALPQLTLEDIVDLALRNNPQTRASWAAARAAAAHLASTEGAYWPRLDATANYSKSQNSFSQQFSVTQKTYTPSLALTWVLFDFGRTSGKVEEARQQLYRANWSHNATIQQVVLLVEQTYYQYQQAKAQRDADAQAVKEAETNLAAAEERAQAGLATRAEVLQARSTLAQARLNLQSVEGRIQTTRGSLATAMGISPTVDYDVELLPSNVPADTVVAAVDEMIEEAVTHRPDLAAARAATLAARAHEKAVNGERWPSLSLQGNVSRRYYDAPNVYSDNYLYGVFLSWPLFSGFSRLNDVREARAQEQQARQQYEALRSSVELDVWTAYYDLKTANARLQTAKEFLDFATESYDVALESYRAGLGTILDLLAAQSTLQNARTQELTARTDWFLALAQLAHATGRLGESTPVATVRPSETPQKERP